MCIVRCIRITTTRPHQTSLSPLLPSRAVECGSRTQLARTFVGIRALWSQGTHTPSLMGQFTCRRVTVCMRHCLGQVIAPSWPRTPPQALTPCRPLMCNFLNPWASVGSLLRLRWRGGPGSPACLNPNPARGLVPPPKGCTKAKVDKALGDPAVENFDPGTSRAFGQPMICRYEMGKKEFTDGFGLCSPGRWPPEAREMLASPDEAGHAKAIREILKDFVCDEIGQLLSGWLQAS